MTIHLTPSRLAGLETELKEFQARHRDKDLETIQNLVAQRYNFASWRQLLNYTQRGKEKSDDFLRLACLQYHPGDHPSNWDRARELYRELPELIKESIYHASVIGDSEGVERFLKSDPDLVNQLGGSLDWPPLLYACYSRLNIQDNSTLDVARILLDHGADPNAYFMWGGQYRFTALTGVLGEGEQGPVNQPRHEHETELATLLLERGASAADGQGLYNRMFTGGTEHLELLFQYGLNPPQKPNWLDVSVRGNYYPSKINMLTYLLDHAIERSHEEIILLLLSHNVKPTRKQRRFAYKKAMLNGDISIAKALIGAGVKETHLTAVERFVSLVMGPGLDSLGQSSEQLEKLCAKAMKSHPDTLIKAVNRDRLDTVNTLIDLGWDVNDDSSGITALHDAAYNGRLEIAKSLVEAGADLTKKDGRFHTTPTTWAKVGGQMEVAAYLEELGH
ncbi:MAG: ankyrin repeat domain-containing protein [Gammaproteobacteria bacterium]|nr:ankyrin repeat domain-containing protein [Gammaproteobacteria bacterium]